jgi:pimeloyl-ACP methyl ester carboxylesterase
MKATVDGIELSYLEQGSAEDCLILLHGGTGTASSYWTSQIEMFARRFRVVALDMRGFGGSTKEVERSIRLDDLAEDLRRILDHLEIGSAHLAGLSLGGCVAQQFALDHPARLRKLVLSDTIPGYLTHALRSFSRDILIGVSSLGPEGRALAQKINLLFAYSYEYLDEHGAELDAQMARDSSAWDSISAEGQARILESLQEWNVVDRLPEIDAPTLILWGSEDIETPLTPYGRTLLEAIPRSCLHVIEGAGHKSCAERPLEWNQAVDAFLSDR